MTVFVVDYYTCGRILLSPSPLLLSNAPDVSVTCGWRPRCCSHVRIRKPASTAHNVTKRKTDRQEREEKCILIQPEQHRSLVTHIYVRDTPMCNRSNANFAKSIFKIYRKGVPPSPPRVNYPRCTLSRERRERQLPRESENLGRPVRDTAAFAHCRRARQKAGPRGGI